MLTCIVLQDMAGLLRAGLNPLQRFKHGILHIVIAGVSGASGHGWGLDYEYPNEQAFFTRLNVLLD